MDDILGRRLGSKFELEVDFCATDSDPTWMTVFRWMIDWAADSDPNSMTTVFRWMMEFDDGWNHWIPGSDAS